MRLLVVVSHYNRRGGFPRYGAQLAVGLAGRGHDVTVLCQDADAGPEDAAITFEHYRLPVRGQLATLAFEPWLLTRVLRRRRREFDVVLVVGLPVLAPVVLFGTGTHRGYVDATLAALRPWRLRWWVERFRPFHLVVLGWERAMLRKPWPALIVVGAERYRHEYPDLYGVPLSKVVAVPLAVEVEEFRFDPDARRRLRAQLDLDDDHRLLVNVAGRGRQKGLDVLVDAVARLPLERRWVAAFAGHGSQSPWLARRAAPLIRTGRVRLLGPVPSTAELFSAADLLVFPSRYDPWGLVVTEALASGLPVVASARAGSSLAVEEGRTGTVLDRPQDPAAVAQAIVSLWDMPVDRAAIAASVGWLSVQERAAALEPHLLHAADGPLPAER